MALGSNNSNMRNRFKREPLAEINVTPFVDVMLVLLVIFMITAPMMTAGVQVDLPKTVAKPVTGNDEPLIISIKKSGNIYLGEDRIKLQEVAERIGAVAGENKDIRLFVRGDTSVDYGRIMEVVGQINAGGFTKVALITESVGKK